MPALQRQIFLANMILQFDNPLYPPQFGAPALLTTASVITDENGVAQGQPQMHPQAAISTDITDVVFDSIQSKMNLLGLRIERIAKSAPPEVVQEVK